MSLKRYNKNIEAWVLENPSTAISTKLMDINGYYDSSNVEGALQEIGDRFAIDSKKVAELNGDINDVKNKFEEHVANHPGGNTPGTGGGGYGTVPEVTTPDDFELRKLEENVDFSIPLRFTSGVIGNGTVYISINNMEYYYTSIVQGKTNYIKIPGIDTTIFGNKITLEIVVKDRAGAYSNILTYNCFCGGIKYDLYMDKDSRYDAGIRIPVMFNVDYSGEDEIIMHLSIDGNERTMSCKKGRNTYYLTGLLPGRHKASFYVNAGDYEASTTNFNITIQSTDQLIVFADFDEEGYYEENMPIDISYSICKDTANSFFVNCYIAEEGKEYGDINKRFDISVANNLHWVISGLPIGKYKLKIDVIEYNLENPKIDTASVEFTCTVSASKYPKVPYTDRDMIAYFNAVGKSNVDERRDVWVDEINGYEAKLVKCNFGTNGWKDNTLVLSGSSHAVIDLKLFENNAKYGITIDMLVRMKDVGDLDARVFSIEDKNTDVGFYVTSYQMTARTLQHHVTTMVTEDEWLHLTFTLDRINSFGKLYINGVMQEAFQLTNTGKEMESIQTNEKIYLNGLRGEEHFGYCEYKNIRIYANDLNDEEVLMNYLADIEDGEERTTKYYRNYPEHNDNTWIIPRMMLTTEGKTGITGMGFDQSSAINMKCKYISPNADLYGNSFDASNTLVYIQGTSSKNYVMKNFNIILRDDNEEFIKYNPYSQADDVIKESLFCLKCNYMESSNANNTGITDYVNKYLYTTPTPPKRKNERCTHAIQGFPFILYIDGEEQGVYDFNLDRYSVESFGYTQFPDCLCYEVSANTESSAGAFNQYDISNPYHATFTTKGEYYADSFSPIYPESRKASDDFKEISELVEFVDSADEDLFRAQFEKWLNKESVIRYYILVYTFGMVDNLGKNMKLTKYERNGQWYLQFYDCDTALGLDNSGSWLVDEKTTERLDVDFEMTMGTFNTATSKLWTKLRLWYDSDIKAEYSRMRKDKFQLKYFMECFYDDNIAKIPERFYNNTFQKKYLDFGDMYLSKMHGSRYYNLKRWLKERLLYMDTLMGYNIEMLDTLMLRSDNLGEISFNIEVFSPMYVTVQWKNKTQSGDYANLQSDIKKIGRGEKVTFTHINTATDQEIEVFGGQHIKALGDISNLKPTHVSLNNGIKLTAIDCRDATTLINLEVSNCKNLQTIDLEGCTSFGTGNVNMQTLNVTGMFNLRYININETSVMSLATDGEGSNIEEIFLPSSLTSINLQNLQLLKTVGLQNGHSCKELKITNCPNVESFGNRVWNSTINDYTYDNSYFLNGVKNLTLDRTLLNLDYLAIYKADGLQSIHLSNMPNLTTIQIGTNSLYDWTPKLDKFHDWVTNEPSADLGDLMSSNDLIINIENCSKLKTIDFTSEGRNINKNKKYTTGEFLGKNSETGRYGTISDKDKTFRLFKAREINLTNTQIETLRMASCVWCYSLVLPTTLKNFYASNKYFANYYDGYENGKKRNKESIIDSYWETYDIDRSAGYGRLGISAEAMGMFIGGITTSQNEIDGDYNNITEKYNIWDFKGITFDNILMYEFNTSPRVYASWNDSSETSYWWGVAGRKILNETYSPKIKYLHEKPINNALGVQGNIYTYHEEADVSIDLSHFTGVCLSRALAYANDTKYTITLPNNNTFDWFKNIIYCNGILNNATLLNTHAKILEPIMAKITSREHQFGTLKLKTQTNYDTDGLDLVCNHYLSSRWWWDEIALYSNVNIKYLKSLTSTKNVVLGSLFKDNDTIEKVGNISLSLNEADENANTSTIFLFTRSFEGCTKLQSVGNITIDCSRVTRGNFYQNPSGIAHLFSGCTSLKTVGNINIINAKVMWDSAHTYGYAPNISMSNCFNGCSNLTTIGNLNIDYVNDYTSAFAGCGKLSTIGTGINLKYATSVNSFLNGCIYNGFSYQPFFNENINDSGDVSHTQMFKGYQGTNYNVKIPSSLKDGTSFFQGSSVTNANVNAMMPTTLNNISCVNMFRDCLKLKSFVNLPKNANNLDGYNNGCLNIGSSSSDARSYTIKIPDSCTNLSNFSGFGRYAQTININIPKSVKTMYGSFWNCSSAPTINFDMEDGELINFGNCFTYQQYTINGMNLGRLSNIVGVSNSVDGISYNYEVCGQWGTKTLKNLRGVLRTHHFSTIHTLRLDDDAYRYLFTHVDYPSLPTVDKYGNEYRGTIIVYYSKLNQGLKDEYEDNRVLTQEQIDNVLNYTWIIQTDDGKQFGSMWSKNIMTTNTQLLNDGKTTGSDVKNLYVSYFIRVNGETEYKIYNTCSNVTVCTYDSKLNCLECVLEDSDSNIFTTTKGATYVRIGYISQSQTAKKINVYDTRSTIELNDSFTFGKQVNSNNTINDVIKWYGTEGCIEVTPNQKYQIRCDGSQLRVFGCNSNGDVTTTLYSGQKTPGDNTIFTPTTSKIKVSYYQSTDNILSYCTLHKI